MKQSAEPSLKNVWMLSREYGDLAGAGGIKDVVQQLAESLAEHSDLAVQVVIPLYGFIDPERRGLHLLWIRLGPVVTLSSRSI